MKWPILLFLTLVSIFSEAGDTLFLRSLPLPDRAFNIDSDGRVLLIRMTHSVVQLEKGEIKELKVPVERRFTWFLKNSRADQMSVFHTHIPPDNKLANWKDVAELVPGFYSSFITAVRLGDYYYICYRGQVLEYVIQDMVLFRYRGMSVRHIYCNDSSKIISTYEGIYKENHHTGEIRKLNGTFYASGETQESHGSIFLCQDGLYKLQGDSLFVRVSAELDNGAFRKLIQWNDKTFCMFTNRVSEFDPEQVTEKNVRLRSESFMDIAVWKNRLFAGDSNGRLFVISPEGTADTIQMASTVWDLLPEADRMYIGCDSGLYVLDEAGIVTPVIESFQAVQVASLKEDLFISNFNGLYFFHNRNLYPIIHNVEFNHRALTLHKNMLYAGSIDGLYYLYVSLFINNVLPTLEPIPLPEKEAPVAVWKIFVIIASTSVTIILIFLLRRKKMQTAEALQMPQEEITPEFIEQIIRSNEKVISVQSLAEHLDTSVVQLNRKLKPFGTTPLLVMQEIKKKIAQEMYAAGEPIDKIARRTGYSARYIREHFLNDPS